MPRSGTLVICVQNLDFSGANQVVLNIVTGRVHESNVVVLSPKVGTFAGRFVESGAAVRIGILEDLLNGIRDVFCIICNTIMTANIVVEMSARPHPVIWILHEWWDDEMIRENLRIRNYQGLTLSTVKQALACAAKVVCVCEAQRLLYQPTAPSSVIFVGVPDPIARQCGELPVDKKVFTFLCLGIICPRKNQLWTVQAFQKFAAGRKDVRLQIVGARHTRLYEIEYLEKVKQAVEGDDRIEIFDVTENVDAFYRTADALVLTSLNEVTPMVIPEALSWGIPVISTNIAGIKEMYSNGVEGFHFPPDDMNQAVAAMHCLFTEPVKRTSMGLAARALFETSFDLDLMVEAYRQLVLAVAPPVVLVDMDGVLVDWDKGFLAQWDSRGPVDRARSYLMEDCVDSSMRAQAIDLYMTKGFFASLPPMHGALAAMHEMASAGLQVFIATSPVKGSPYCAQEKLDWVRAHLGEDWMDKVVICQDKSLIAGDLLIDDKPFDQLSPNGRHTAATWKQIIFDAPYNRQKRLPRMHAWEDWREFIIPLLGGRACPAGLLSGSTDEFLGMGAEQLSGKKLQRNTSFSSVQSSLSTLTVRSVEEVQRAHDMLAPADCAPLLPEELATIVSSSMSLVDDTQSEDTDEDCSLRLSFRTAASAGPDEENPAPTILGAAVESAISEKRKMLQDKLRKRNEDYRKAKDTTVTLERLRADSVEIEGLQTFRPSHQSWTGQGPGGRKGQLATKQQS